MLKQHHNHVKTSEEFKPQYAIVLVTFVKIRMCDTGNINLTKINIVGSAELILIREGWWVSGHGAEFVWSANDGVATFKKQQKRTPHIEENWWLWWLQQNLNLYQNGQLKKIATP